MSYCSFGREGGWSKPPGYGGPPEDEQISVIKRQFN